MLQEYTTTATTTILIERSDRGLHGLHFMENKAETMTGSLVLDSILASKTDFKGGKTYARTLARTNIKIRCVRLQCNRLHCVITNFHDKSFFPSSLVLI